MMGSCGIRNIYQFLKKLKNCFSNQLYHFTHFTFVLITHEGFSCNASSSTLYTLILDFLISVQCYEIAVLICISPVINDVERHFNILITINLYSLIKCSNLLIFLNWVPCCLTEFWEFYIYSGYKGFFLLDTQFANIFFRRVTSFFQSLNNVVQEPVFYFDNLPFYNSLLCVMILVLSIQSTQG